MASLGSRRREAINVWPGWVDALSSLVMVFLFVLMVFAVAQFYLSAALSRREEVVETLNRRIAELGQDLRNEQKANAELRDNLTKMTAHLNETGQRAQTTSEQANKTARDLADTQKNLAAEQEKSRQQAQKIQSLEEENRELSEQRSRLETNLAVNQRNMADLWQTIQNGADERDRLSQQLTARQAEVTQLTENLATSTNEVEAARKELEATRVSRDALSQEAATLRARVATLEETLVAERAQTAQGLQMTAAERQAFTRQLRHLLEGAQNRDLALAEAENRIRELNLSLGQAQTVRDQKAVESSDFARQIDQLKTELDRMSTLLNASEERDREQEVQIAALGARLNQALAGQVEELARYRSEFFGRLRDVVGNRSDIRIVGDRFVFQSEVLFNSGSAALEDRGRERLALLANALKRLASEIPPTVNWILRVDGHTDRKPIATPQFPSNWELSTARALSVVRFLIEQGIPAERLAAAGFASLQPLDAGDDDTALARNRRIELKLDQR